MAKVSGRSRCITCGKEKAILKCGGCTQDYCYNHFGNHRQELNKQLEEIEINRDLFRQTLTEQTTDLQRDSLLQQIDEWERDSIIKIQQTAEETRQMLFKYNIEHTKQIEVRLNKLTDQLRQGHEENDFVETDLSHWNEQLTRLTNELTKSSNITVRQDSKPLVTKLYIDIATRPICVFEVDKSTKWSQNGITVAGGNGDGPRLNQLSRPLGIYVDDDQTIYVADQCNHRIMKWKSDAHNGQIVAGGNGQGNRSNQLIEPISVVVDKKNECLIICDYGNKRVIQWNHQNNTSGQTIISNINCSHLTIDHEGYLYACDPKKHEVKRWQIGDTNGTVVAGGNGKGNCFDQLHTPTHIFIDKDHSVYVSDWGNHRVMKWMKDAKEGIVVAGGQGHGNSLRQLLHPQGVTVDKLDTVYVVDSSNHRVMRWYKGATQGDIVIGGNGEGEQSNQLNNPQNLSFDRQGNLYVVDQWNHRVQKFNIISV